MALSKQKRAISERLGSMVKARFAIAEQANLEAHQRCMDCLRQLRGELTPIDPDDELSVDVTMNITAPITRGLQAMMAEILDPISSQPFTLSASPVVDLPEDTMRELQEAVEQNLPLLVERVGGDMAALKGVITELVQTTTQYYNDAAAKAAERLTATVSDRLFDADFDKEFSDWLYNFIAYPTAILKGPVSEMRKRKQWAGTRMVVQDVMTRVVRNVSPFNLYPAPNARDLHSCEYVIERMRVNSSDLLDMIPLPGYDMDGIDYALESFDRYIIDYAASGSTKAPDEDESTDDQRATDYGFYDILIYYGQISGRDLEEFGVSVDDVRRMYEAEVWVVNDIVIKAVLNPDAMGRRPFEAASFLPTPGEFWGTSPVEMIRDAQVQCTMAGRALARNMEFASGPMGEVDTRKVLGDDDPTEIYPLMLKAVKTETGNTNPVYRFHTVPSLADELMAVYSRFSEVAYELLGIPRLAFGQAAGAGSIGRTSGGVAMVMNQAAKPVKQAMGVAERQVIEPVIQKFVDYELMFNDDPTIKGDVNVQATGVRGLAEREQKEGRLEWALQSLGPFLSAGLVPPAYALRLLVEMFKQNGISTKGLPDFDMQDAINSDLGQTLTGDGAPSPGLPDAAANLDGRSQTAIDTINTMNNPAGV